MAAFAFDPARSLIVLSDVYRRPAYGGLHPLAIPRMATVADIANDLGWLGARLRPSPVAPRALIERFHDPVYVQALIDCERSGCVPAPIRARHQLGTMENPLFAGAYERSATSVAGSYQAARLALDGRVVFHPAGGTHHGQPDRASGFCYFNDPVFALLGFLDAGLARVLYVDIDAHHGDGVEDAYAHEPRVFTISLHEEGRWPGTGGLHDRREGHARNLPFPRGVNDDEYLLLIEAAVLPVARAFAPQAVVITCGADGHRGDPLSAMNLSNGAIWRTVEALCGLAPRTVVLGGGGYNAWTLARLWVGLWGRLAGLALPQVLPAISQARLRNLDCDLVDEDERDPAWTQTLFDRPSRGPIRPVFHAIVAATLADHGPAARPAPARQPLLT